MTTIARVVRSGQTYSESASVLIDGNSATVADLLIPANNVNPDFFRVDLGAATVINAVNLVNVWTPTVVQGQAVTAALYATNNAAAAPGDAGTVLFGFSHIGLNQATYPEQSANSDALNYPGTALGATPYRYVLVMYTGDQLAAQQVQTGEIVVNPTGPVFHDAALGAAGTQLVVNLTVPGVAPLLPAAGIAGFLVRVAGSLCPVTSATAAGSAVTLTLGQTVFAGQSVTVAYTPGNVTDSATPPAAMSIFGEQPVTNNSTQAAPAIASVQNRLFSTGTLVANWVDGMGAARTATFATLQDISLEVTFDRTDLWDAAQISLFPVDCADSMGKVQLKASNATVSADTLQRLIAASLAGTLGAGTVTASLPKSVVLPSFQAVFTGTASDGKQVIVTFGKAKAKGASWALKIKDFAIQGFTLDCYPDADGVVATFAFQN